MSTISPMTAEQLLELPDDGNHYELIAGELRMMSHGNWKHGRIALEIGSRLAAHIREHELGYFFAAETGFLIAREPDTVRAPDVAFVASRNIPSPEPQEAYWPGAPDLAVEVLSPHDRMGEVDEKIGDWLAAGCRMVWVVDPQLATITVYLSRTEVRVATCRDEIDGGDVLPGFRCAVGELLGAT
ncbi:MAG: Uma2 family endonuclease [Pirellulales bacterium]